MSVNRLTNTRSVISVSKYCHHQTHDCGQKIKTKEIAIETWLAQTKHSTSKFRKTTASSTPINNNLLIYKVIGARSHHISSDSSLSLQTTLSTITGQTVVAAFRYMKICFQETPIYKIGLQRINYMAGFTRRSTFSDP